MSRLKVVLFGIMLVLPVSLCATEIHVATNGQNSNPGTRTAPLRTIQRAAEVAQPGDLITVHQGIYRERIAPPRGGISDQKRIVYQAAPGEKVGTDYFSKPRDHDHPTPGPFQNLGRGPQKLKVW